MSIADASALHVIYSHSVGHGTPTKAELYTAFNPFPGTQTIFSTRSRDVHARKRKLIAHTFSLKSVTDFEPIIRKYNRVLLQHWDRICAAAAKGQSGIVGECNWKARDGYAFLDCLVCEFPFDMGCLCIVANCWVGFNFQVFDIIGMSTSYLYCMAPLTNVIYR